MKYILLILVITLFHVAHSRYYVEEYLEDDVECDSSTWYGTYYEAYPNECGYGDSSYTYQDCNATGSLTYNCVDDLCTNCTEYFEAFGSCDGGYIYSCLDKVPLPIRVPALRVDLSDPTDCDTILYGSITPHAEIGATCDINYGIEIFQTYDGNGTFGIACGPGCVGCAMYFAHDNLPVCSGDIYSFAVTVEILGASGIRTPHVASQVWSDGEGEICAEADWDYVFFQQLPTHVSNGPNEHHIMACTDDGHLGHFVCYDELMFNNCTAIELVPQDTCFSDGEGLEGVVYSATQSYYITCGDSGVAPLAEPAIEYREFADADCEELVFGGSTLINEFNAQGTTCFYFNFLEYTFNYHPDGTIDAFCTGNPGGCPGTECAYSFFKGDAPAMGCFDFGSWSLFGEFPIHTITTSATELTSDSGMETSVETSEEETNMSNQTDVSSGESSEGTSEDSEDSQDSSAISLCLFSFTTLLILN
jgi:hypothetical protein